MLFPKNNTLRPKHGSSESHDWLILSEMAKVINGNHTVPFASEHRCSRPECRSPLYRTFAATVGNFKKRLDTPMRPMMRVIARNDWRGMKVHVERRDGGT